MILLVILTELSPILRLSPAFAKLVIVRGVVPFIISATNENIARVAKPTSKSCAPPQEYAIAGLVNLPQ